ncbi:MAG: hypothetical protein ACI35O_16445 [Bacillaceae bacterium]
MSYNRTQTRLRLNEETLQYLSDFAEDYGLPYTSLALEQIVREHKQFVKQNWNLQYVSEAVAEKVSRSVQVSIKHNVSNELNKIRLGTNNADRNSQILIELVQAHMEMDNVKNIMTTDMYKPDFLEQAEKVVHERIIHQKQKKDAKQKEKEGDN